MAMTLKQESTGGTAPATESEQWRRWIAPAVQATMVAALLWLTPPAYAQLVSPESHAGPYPELTALVTIGGLASVGGVLLARWRPWWAALLPLAPFLLLPWTGWFVWGWFAALVSVASIAALDGLRRALVPTIAAVGVAIVYSASTVYALLPIGPVTSGRQTPDGVSATSWLGLDSRVTPVLVVYVVAIFAVVGISWAAGGVLRARVARVAAEQTEHRALAVESAAAERARVARDLHDVVAHHVSLVAVRAESAPYQHPTLDDEARTVLAAIAHDARAALGELRQVLTVLQRAEGAAAERAPQPGVADIEALISDARSAGQHVETVDAWGEVPAAQGYVLYRAVQEGLSNARRHAPEAPVKLEWRRTEGDVGFTLANACSQDGPPGRGLLGMRERVEALGGTLRAGRSEEAFVLNVELPVAEQ